ncbi:unnamed protein product [Rhizopus stolonifer]
MFKEYKLCTHVERVKSKIKEARKSAYKVLLEVYGRRGKVRHYLLDPYLNHYKPADFTLPEPFVPHVPHTAPPPPLCPPLRILITQHLGKRLEPELPQPAFKPLHPGRKANLLWKYRSMLLDRLQVPLPFEIVCELETKAGAQADHPVSLKVLARGGPRLDFYNPRHLLHFTKPALPLSKVVRSQTLADRRSPYEAKAKTDPLEYLQGKSQPEPKLIRFTQAYDSRQKRRLYRRLLNEVPCIDILTGDSLWKRGMNFKLSKSNWAVKGVTEVLRDVPSEEVIESTLKNKKRK